MKITIKKKKIIKKKKNEPVPEIAEISEQPVEEITDKEMTERERLIYLRKIQNQAVQEGSKDPLTGLTKDYKKLTLYSIYTIATLAAVFAIAYLSIKIIDYKKFIPIDSALKKVELPNTASSSGSFSSSSPQVPILRDQENPVNGVMVTKAEMDAMKARKLVVVSVNNHTLARPQFGLSRADMVFEVLAEGGITRYNAYYYQDQSVPKVGPVRSARSYMLYELSGFDDPVFVHEGQASYPPQERAIPEINTLKQIYDWHIRDMQTPGALYRDPVRRKQRGSVHSLMTGFALINKEVTRLKWNVASNITPLKFKYDDPVEARGTAVKIEVRFSSIGGKTYYSSFDYDVETNSYLRSIGGTPDTDANDGSRLAPKNVIIEYHNYRDAMDGHSRIIIDMLGEGELFVFRDGQMIKGKWKKAKRTDRTKYYDSTGSEIELNRGQIWLINAIRTKTHKVSDMYVNGKIVK